MEFDQDGGRELGLNDVIPTSNLALSRLLDLSLHYILEILATF
jgi:hypothetical protein